MKRFQATARESRPHPQILHAAARSPRPVAASKCRHLNGPAVFAQGASLTERDTSVNLSRQSVYRINFKPNWILRGSAAVVVIALTPSELIVAAGCPKAGVLVKLKLSARNCSRILSERAKTLWS